MQSSKKRLAGILLLRDECHEPRSEECISVLRRENQPPLPKPSYPSPERGWGSPWTEGAGSKRGCWRAGILTGQNLFKTVFFQKKGGKQGIIPAVDTRDPWSDPAFVLLANGVRTGSIWDHLFWESSISRGQGNSPT